MKEAIRETMIIETNNCGQLEVIKYNGCNDIEVRFINTGYTTTTQASHLRIGSVRDPLCASVFGVGRLGIGGKEIKTTKRGMKAYMLWKKMLERCYSEKSLLRRPMYQGVTVYEEWKDFTNFYEWWSDNYVEGFELDKDILAGNTKVYSPQTCCYVPRELNLLFRDTSSTRGDLPEGVFFDKKLGKFKASIGVDGNLVNLGHFTDIVEAEKKYLKAKATHILLLILKWSKQIDMRASEKLYQIAVGMRPAT